MVDLYNKIELLCKSKNINITTMCKNIGLSRSTMTELKQGRSKTLLSETLTKTATYFGVSVDYLLGKEDTKKAPAKQEPDDDDIKFALFGGSGEITDEMYAEVKAFAKFVKQREKEKKK